MCPFPGPCQVYCFLVCWAQTPFPACKPVSTVGPNPLGSALPMSDLSTRSMLCPTLSLRPNSILCIQMTELNLYTALSSPLLYPSNSRLHGHTDLSVFVDICLIFMCCEVDSHRPSHLVSHLNDVRTLCYCRESTILRMLVLCILDLFFFIFGCCWRVNVMSPAAAHKVFHFRHNV